MAVSNKKKTSTKISCISSNPLLLIIFEVDPVRKIIFEVDSIRKTILNFQTRMLKELVLHPQIRKNVLQSQSLLEI